MKAFGNFAEQMGSILGTAEKQARSWLNQRSSIAGQLAQIRDKADSLLRELSGGAANAVSAIAGAGRGRPPASAKKTAKRKGRTFTAAQRKEQAERMRKFWAARRKTANKRTAKKAARRGGEVGNG